ncbi:Superfamily I DNA helicase [Neorhizobium galegae bv. officinalis]|uniref:Superfamily I DNA helicase n=1 Tax=Neorhizobium galegae bv. officinalis TaxID=323656 RepID=A0A0T7F958_NEOGA|nr:AAA domain-containing protein [Neorhizobium galegae]CDZ31594.1 Superfamily I DNA helicase [Neorhizobium galegae bv. officinalis]
MKRNVDAILRYWRTSLADGALGEGQFSQRDRQRFIELSAETLRNGLLPKQSVSQLFKDQPKAKVVGVRLWPLVVARRSSHGAASGDGLPEMVAPVVTEALVDVHGKISPQRNTIARDLLTPLPSDEFSIGAVDALDSFLTAEPLQLGDRLDWANYLAHCRKMLDAVAEGWPAGDQHYVPAGFGLLEPAEDVSATVRNILNLYDKILADRPKAPLLNQIVSPVERLVTDTKIETAFARRLGHSNPHFPLAEQQRQVLAWLDAAVPGDVIAVNGPPGTGKTTLLLSAVAGLWVRAALNGGEPPVIVATSSNNQAVTNIIDAFGKDFAKGDGPLAGRWLPGVDSFGIFLPANSRRQEASEKYQTEDFQTRMETVDRFLAAKNAWLTSASAAFPDVQGNVAEYVSVIQRAIAYQVAKLEEADRSLEQQFVAMGKAQEFGGDPAAAEAGAQTSVSERGLVVERMKHHRAEFDRQQAQESSLLAFFSFLPAVERKRVLRARVALGGLSGLDGLKRISEIDQHLARWIQKAEVEYASAKEALNGIRTLMAEINAAQSARKKALISLDGGDGLEDGLEDRIDLCQRFELFRLATHYWEGRWLMAMEADLTGIVASATKRGRSTLVPRWHRRMMLTPCAVSTFASLPSKLSYSRRNGAEWANEYLYDFIDLLIIDEAGQALPEVAGAAFALAKRALVIGDTKQIEPISAVPRAVDVGNLREAGLLEEGADIQNLDATGLCSTSGSAMRLAQQACQVSPWSDLEPGLWLFEHRRCHDEIIEYSNALCYKGKLRPRRGAAPSDALLPAMGYVHVDGKAVRAGNSRSNPTEAQTIGAWIAENRRSLEARYNHPVEQIVGIVTPFGAQVRELRRACSAHKLTVSGRTGLTIGTVHALQGAERPVVIFSPVYSKHADGGFIDSSPSMLNVTVSRAKDSFLLFGDMDVLANATPGSPRALLSSFLDQPGLELGFQPTPRADLQESEGPLQILRDAADHDAFLLNVLSADARCYLIVSPWIRLRTMERTGILKALELATARGAKIDIYADPLLNGNPTPGGTNQIEEAAAALKQIGVSLHRLEKLHSKIIAVDDDLLCLGSFNWLSAAREGQYVRHETSYVYRGKDVEAEIRVTKEDLKRRAR